MKTETAATPIPWTYSDSPGVLLWTWMTEHFVAKISGSQAVGAAERTVRSYDWQLADLMKTQQGLPRVLVEGTSSSFEEAEAQIQEHVGKCYDPRLSYQQYCGARASTFTLASGASIDVGPLIGTHCVVEVLLAGGNREVVSGDLSVHHYMWRLRDHDAFLELRPEHVVSISNRSAIAERAAQVAYPPTYSGIGRIYRTEVSTGCTGSPGFAIGTVDHAGAPKCPVHESALPAEMLR